MRLSKLMSERGICSRREADRYIEQGLVQVDGKVVSELGTKVDPDVEVRLLDKATQQQNQKVTILLHKPVGYVSTQPEKGYKAAIELIPKKFREGLSTAGRLDIDSKGLLVFTQDGRTVKSIIGPDSDMEKEYLVRFEGTLTKPALQRLRLGLQLDGKDLLPARVQEIEPNLLQMILRQGKKRQIRKMMDLVGLHVTSLKRVRVGRVRLGDLPSGKWRFLGKNEKF